MSNLLEKIDDYIIDDVQDATEPEEDLFTIMADFIIDLDPEKLTDEQLEKVMKIIDNFEYEDIEEARLANKTNSDEKNYARRYYRKNKIKVQAKKKKFKASAEGRKRDRVEQVKAKLNRTPTGRKKVEYHRRVV